jgi:hypothetical protein
MKNDVTKSESMQIESVWSSTARTDAYPENSAGRTGRPATGQRDG